jgi:hypothetical protein
MMRWSCPHQIGFVLGVFSFGLWLALSAAGWPVPGSEDTELGVLMEPEVGHGETTIYTRVQA